MDAERLSWGDHARLVDDIATRVTADGKPDVIVGVLRGGAVPAVMLAHRLGLRDVRTLTVVHTTADGVNAPKHTEPRVTDTGALGGVGGMDVLVVDDVAGSGKSIELAHRLVSGGNAKRIRTAVCVLNLGNWPEAAPTPDIVGRRVHRWVIFPWEVS
ncbi:purine phosphoribosyltransferase [Actinomadura sp. KC06]|uniref:phosphoribosyltransferase n=1 Tax=Actinomadura sp. KC06 TaxID=2530369 RepID=UPI00104DD6CB|nr:phosphoribosyltransferase family protein [Actinomadura sp. KC06]TDD31220.1 purine phosphoribosyltransferase [Actinomadura sp. KC06]